MHILNVDLTLSYHKSHFVENPLDEVEKHGLAIQYAKQYFKQQFVINNAGYLIKGFDKTLDSLDGTLIIESNIDELHNFHKAITGEKFLSRDDPSFKIEKQYWHLGLDEQKQLYIPQVQSILEDRSDNLDARALGAIVLTESKGAAIVHIPTDKEIEHKRTLKYVQHVISKTKNFGE